MVIMEKNKFKSVKDIRYLFNEEEDESAHEDIRYLFNELHLNQ